MATLIKAEKGFFELSRTHLQLEAIEGDLIVVNETDEMDERAGLVKLRRLLSERKFPSIAYTDKNIAAVPLLHTGHGKPGNTLHKSFSRSLTEVNHSGTFHGKGEVSHLQHHKYGKFGSNLSVAAPDHTEKPSALEKKPHTKSMPCKINVAGISSPAKNQQKGNDNRATKLILPKIERNTEIVRVRYDLVSPGSTVSESEEEEEDSEDDELHLESESGESESSEDWVYEEKLKEQQKRFERQKKALLIREEDNAVQLIDGRVKELAIMTKPRKDHRTVFERLDEQTRERILRVTAITNEEIREKNKKMKLKDRLKWTVGMVRLILRCFWNRKLYFEDEADGNKLRKKMEKEISAQTTFIATTKSSVGSHMEASLRIPHEIRSKRVVEEILWLLHRTKAFSSLFPQEMERELAARVSYERYDDGRLIARQAAVPDNFYYVLGGRVGKIRHIVLETGFVTKHMGDLNKGATTDPEEMERGWTREESLVAHGPVEVLLLDQQSFMFLLTTHQGPPVEFLKSIDIFEEFAAEDFLNHPDSIEYKYYGQGRLVVKDTNRTPWLHIVKSGKVKVIRRQTVTDSQSLNKVKFSTKRLENLGVGKLDTASHATVMLGVQANQRKIKKLIAKYQENTKNPHSQTLGLHTKDDKEDDEHSSITPTSNTALIKGSKDRKSSADVSDISADQDRERLENRITAANKAKTVDANGRRSPTKLPSINVPTKTSIASDSSSGFNPLAKYLLRERTLIGDELLRNLLKKPQTKTIPTRRTFLQLDVLKPGEVFGLDRLQPALASDPVAVSLVSDGAEIVKIHKRFFLQFATNNTRMKVELMYKKYMTDEEAQDSLYQQETWKQYREKVWSKITESMKVPS